MRLRELLTTEAKPYPQISSSVVFPILQPSVAQVSVEPATGTSWKKINETAF